MNDLHQSNAKHKTDVLDWKRLPTGECDLNFRKPSSHDPSDLRRTLIALWIVSLLTTLVGAFLRTQVIGTAITGQTLWMLFWTGGVLLILAVFGLPRILPLSFPNRNTFLTVVESVLGILLLWFLAGLLGSTSSGGMTWLLLAALPVTLFAADSLTTHGIFWYTSNPRVDRRTMTAWRDDWSLRFMGMSDRPLRAEANSPQARQDHQAAMRLRRSYRLGFLWLLPVFYGIPLLLVFLSLAGIVERLEFWTVVEITLALVWLASVRRMQLPTSPRLFRWALASWANYGRTGPDPPWVFQSPSGSQPRRAIQGFLAVILLAISVITTLAGDFPLAQDSPLFWFLGLLVAACLPPLWFVLSCYLVSAPALVAYHLACEARGAFEQHPDWRELDGYFERLRNSRNREESRHLMAGYNPTHEYPFLLDTELLFEHFHVLGATGTGKTALGLATHVIQLIRRNDGPVIVVDCKGDPAFFHTVRLEAERAAREFKWFTNKPYRSTYIFNPLNQSHLKRLTLPDLIGLVTQSLNLHHGDDYGRAWFSIGSRVLMKAALLASAPEGSAWGRRTTRYAVGNTPPVQSFRDLEDVLSSIVRSDDEYQAGRHLLFLVESLADFDQLNLAPNRDPNHPALKHAIHMPDVIDKQQIVYFSLVGAIDIASVGELARMVLYSTLSAAIAHRDRTGKRPRIYFIADEAQALAAKNLEMVLAQAREYGLACVLAHQTLSQLNPPGGVDLRELVMNCTAVKQYFSAKDPVLQKYISQISGTVRYGDASWDQLPERIMRGEVGPRFAAGPPGRILVNVRERLGARLESEDLQDISRQLNQCVFAVDRASGYSQFHGAFPMHSDFPVSKTEHEQRREQLKWPEGGEATVELAGYWPEETEQTITPTTHPGAGLPDPGPDVQKRLRDLRDKLKQEDP